MTQSPSTSSPDHPPSISGDPVVDPQCTPFKLEYSLSDTQSAPRTAAAQRTEAEGFEYDEVFAELDRQVLDMERPSERDEQTQVPHSVERQAHWQREREAEEGEGEGEGESDNEPSVMSSFVGSERTDQATRGRSRDTGLLTIVRVSPEVPFSDRRVVDPADGGERVEEIEAEAEVDSESFSLAEEYEELAPPRRQPQQRQPELPGHLRQQSQQS
jgi:hypothetical protein